MKGKKLKIWDFERKFADPEVAEPTRSKRQKWHYPTQVKFFWPRPISKSSVSGGVKPKGETASIVEMKAESKIPVKTFPIKKGISTELFVDGKQGLCKQK